MTKFALVSAQAARLFAQARATWWQETWRRNLAIVWLASLLGSAAITSANAFLPLFLSHEFGITAPSTLAFWTGTLTALNGVALIIASPLWGSVTDRHRGKRMLIRALAGSGLFVAVMAVAQAPWHLALARLGLGAVTGFMPTGSAIIAAQTPRAHVGWALGVFTSSFAGGGAIGPFVTGFLMPVVGLRSMLIFSGALLTGAAVLVAVVMREARQEAAYERPHVLSELRAVNHRTVITIFFLFAAQCFLWMGLQSAQPMVALRVLNLAPAAAASVTGIAFALFGATSAGAAMSYARLAHRVGFRGVAFIGIALASAAVLTGAATSSLVILVGVMALLGLASGMIQPAMTSMLGLESPQQLVGVVFGCNNSALALGLATGPFVIGILAASYGAALGLALSVVPLLLIALALLCVREPKASLNGPQVDPTGRS